MHDQSALQIYADVVVMQHTRIARTNFYSMLMFYRIQTQNVLILLYVLI